MDQDVKDDIKGIRLDVHEIKIVMAVNTESLIHHVARTSANEARIIYLERALIGLCTVGVLGGLIKLFIS